MKKSLVIFAVLLMSIMLFVSCDKGNNETPKVTENVSDTETGVPDDAPTFADITDPSEYVIVYEAVKEEEPAEETEEASEEADGNEETQKDETAADIAVALQSAINEKLGVSIEIYDDSNAEQPKEILLGKTNREQSQSRVEDVRYGEYFIGFAEDKIVILGDSVETLAEAVAYFTENCMVSESKSFKVADGEGYHKYGDYTVRDITIDGVSIMDFEVYTEAELMDKEAMAEIIKTKLTGKDIVFAEEMKADGHYIVLDNTALVYDTYSYEVKDGNLYISSSFSTIYKAVERLGTEYLAAKNTDKYDITSADNYEGSIGKQEFYTKEQLKAVLTKVYDDPDSIIIGQQTMYSVKGTADEFEEVMKEKIAMIGIDLTSYGFDLMVRTEEDKSRFFCEIVEFVAEGGIINVSSHFTNPSGNIPEGEWQDPRGTLGGFNSSEEYEKAFADVITPGTEYNANFTKELKEVGRFLKAIQNAGVPTLYRPFHEMNGYWFWWHVGQGKH